MKTIGMLGGMSWESTVTYYQVLNTTVKERLGGLHSAKCLLHSVDFHELETCLATGDWQRIGYILGQAAAGLERAGAECIIICTNTMHKMADAVAAAVSVPLLHIADLTADELAAAGAKKVALLGTKYTMEQDFYTARLTARGFGVLVPEEADRNRLNSIIFEELCLGVVKRESKEWLLELIASLAEKGAEGIILGCTELGMLAEQDDTRVPLYDTACIHARRAAEYALDSRAPVVNT